MKLIRAFIVISHRYIELLLAHLEQAYSSCSQCQGLTSWRPLCSSRYLTYVRDHQDIKFPSWLKRPKGHLPRKPRGRKRRQSSPEELNTQSPLYSMGQTSTLFRPFLRFPPELRAILYCFLPLTELFDLGVTSKRMQMEVQHWFYKCHVLILEPVQRDESYLPWGDMTPVITFAAGRSYSYNSYDHALDMLRKMPLQVRHMLRKVALVASSPYDQNIRSTLNSLRNNLFSVRNLTIVFDMPCLPKPQRHVKRLWKRTHRAFIQAWGRPRCKRLILVCEEDPFIWGLRNLPLWAHICQSLADALNGGSPLAR